LKSMWNKIGISSALTCFAIAAALVAQTGSATRQPSGTRVGAAAAAPATAAAEAVKYRALLDKYCVGCHNSRSAVPADDPIRLDVGFDDLLGHAATWERVLRKLSVRALPPLGMPRPTEAEYAGFTCSLAGSLDRACGGRSTPGRFVVHRLNRAEYANAIRDLLAVDLDVSDLLPA